MHVRRAGATGRRCGDVVGVGVAAVAGDLAVDARAAGRSPARATRAEERRALGDHEAVAVGVERAGGELRVVVARRAQRAHAGERGDRDRR